MKVIKLGRCDYESTYLAMRDWTRSRSPATPDQLWLCEHPPVFTQGVAGRPEHVLHARGIPVIQTDRGGQITYHGPGQVVAYPLLDLRARSMHVKTYVARLEDAVLDVLDGIGVAGIRVPGAPGIYVSRVAGPPAEGAGLAPASIGESRWHGLAKIAALGIKVTRHHAYHGVALNVAMNLSPFDDIHPCGYDGLKTVDLATLGLHVTWDDMADRLADRLSTRLPRAAVQTSPAGELV